MLQNFQKPVARLGVAVTLFSLVISMGCVNRSHEAPIAESSTPESVLPKSPRYSPTASVPPEGALPQVSTVGDPVDTQGGASSPDAVEAEKEKVRLAVRELWEAYRVQDVERLKAIIDDEFLDEDGNDKEQCIAHLTRPGFIVKTADVDYHNAKVRLDGDRAVVSYRATAAIAMDGKGFHFENESTDVFVKRNGLWRLYRGTESLDVKQERLSE